MLEMRWFSVGIQISLSAPVSERGGTANGKTFPEKFEEEKNRQTFSPKKLKKKQNGKSFSRYFLRSVNFLQHFLYKDKVILFKSLTDQFMIPIFFLKQWSDIRGHIVVGPDLKLVSANEKNNIWLPSESDRVKEMKVWVGVGVGAKLEGLNQCWILHIGKSILTFFLIDKFPKIN